MTKTVHAISKNKTWILVIRGGGDSLIESLKLDSSTVYALLGVHEISFLDELIFPVINSISSTQIYPHITVRKAIKVKFLLVGYR